jgi:hypothetical protein
VLAALASMVRTGSDDHPPASGAGAQLAVAQRFAEHLAAEAGGRAGDAVELASRSVAAELAGVLHVDRVVQAGWPAPQNSSPGTRSRCRRSRRRIGPAHVRQIQDAGGTSRR